MDLEQLLRECEQAEKKLFWEGTFAQYLGMVTQNPSLARLSHARIFDLIMAEGVDTAQSDYPLYALFQTELYGLEKQLDRLVQYFAAAARRFEVRRRILLLLGPPASGKSTIVTLLKRGLERYPLTDEGAIYAIKGCPMQEEPLHLIPAQLRPQLEEEYGLYIEGDLCPRCRYVLRHDHEGQVSQMPVRRIALSEAEGVGIGGFVAAESENQTVGVLVGSIDESQLGGDRLDVAGRAYRLDGELNVANRGLMEFMEIFKCDERLLTVLLGLVQEQVIKMGKFGSVYADEAVIAHSNEGDFRRFVADERTEALQDRIITVNIPYNIRVSEEVRIYQKMLREAGFQGVHISPLTIPTLAVSAVLSRIVPPTKPGMSLVDKLRLYDGQFVPPYGPKEVLEMQEEAPREGMEGISPRYVMNRLATVVTQKGVGCLLPMTALASLWQGLGEHIPLIQDQGQRQVPQKNRHIVLMEETVKEYQNAVRRAVQMAFVEDFRQRSSDLFNSYWESVKAFCTGQKMRPPQTMGVEMEPDEKAMRRIEGPVGISERDKARFRQGLYQQFTGLENRGRSFDYTTDPRIRGVIERMLFPDLRSMVQALTSRRSQGAAVAETPATVIQRLTREYGFCGECAEDAINYTRHVQRGGKTLRVQHHGRIRWLWIS